MGNTVSEMETARDYLARKHQDILTNRYRSENCGIIALNVAKRLIAEGENPQIELVYEGRMSGGRTTILELVPHFLRGEITPWHAHNVCTTDTRAYDPLLGKPVRREDYTTLLFGEKIKMKIGTSREKIQEEINAILG